MKSPFRPLLLPGLAKLLALALALACLPACQTLTLRIPIGENAKYGTALIGYEFPDSVAEYVQKQTGQQTFKEYLKAQR